MDDERIRPGSTFQRRPSVHPTRVKSSQRIRASVEASHRPGRDGRRAPAGGIPMARRARPRAARTSRSCTSPTRTPRPMPPGRARRCRQRPSGSWPHAAGSMAATSSGATSRRGPASAAPTTGTATSRGARSPATARARRSPPSRPTESACSIWPATSGNGRLTGTPRGIPRTWTSRAAFHRTRAGRRSKRATTRHSRSSGSRAR
jgi:hypothetical protein